MRFDLVSSHDARPFHQKAKTILTASHRRCHQRSNTQQEPAEKDDCTADPVDLREMSRLEHGADQGRCGEQSRRPPLDAEHTDRPERCT